MANVKLSPEELRLVTDAELILTKNRIIEKVYTVFGELAAVMQEEAFVLPQHLTGTHPKISRGENYRGLPWVMLDYPRNFSKTDVFAVRCFFWWGHYFTISLQLQGRFRENYLPALSKYLQDHEDWLICVGTDPWEHHISSENYQTATSSILNADLPFIKLTKKIPLTEWDNAFDFYLDNFRKLLRSLSA